MDIILPPQIIWIYWHQGVEQAPEVVRKCISSWKELNPSYEVRVLDRHAVVKFVDTDLLAYNKAAKKSLAAYSDVLRINLLEKYGGIWVDSTLLCLQPLSQWLERKEYDFFAFSNPGPDRMVSSWFLAADRESYIVQQWKKACDAYWSRWKLKRPYYWLHYLFGEIYNSDELFKERWDFVEKINSDGPHHLTPFRQKFFEEATAERKTKLLGQNSPVLKLTYKCLQDGYPRGSMIDYVLHEL